MKTYKLAGWLVTILAFVFYLQGHINGYVAFLLILSTCEITWTTGIVEAMKRRFGKDYTKHDRIR